MPACPECGRQQERGRFCGRCGAALPGGAAEQEPATRVWEEAGRAGRARRGWTAGVIGAVVAALAVAVWVAARPGARPEPPPATPAATEPPIAPAATEPPVAVPPRPTTEVLDCPGGSPGCPLWRTRIPDADAVTVLSPGLDARHVYAGVTLADGTGALYAFDPTNGLQLWRRPLPGPAGRPLVADWGEVIVAFDDPAGGSALRAFDAGTGADRWEAAMSTRASTAPVAVGRSVVIAGPGALLRRDVDRSTAAITELTGRPDALVGTDQDGLFLLLEDQRVEARDQHGTRLWSRDGSAVAASATGGVTALLEPAGDVVGVHVRAGELWRTRVGAAGIAPVVVDDLVVVVTRTGEIVSLALADGTERSRTPWPVEVGAELTVADGRVYVPTCAGIVAADLTSDVQLWFAPLDLPAGTCAATPTVAPGDEGPLLVSEGDTLIGIRR